MTVIEKIDPEILHEIDKTTNIIICIPPSDKCLIESPTPDVLSVLLTQDVNLSSVGKNISPNITSVDYKPRIKFMIPMGLKMNIVEPENGDLVNIFDKVYCDYESFQGYDSEGKEPSYMILENLIFTLYIDVIQMRKKMAPFMLNKEGIISNIYFSWYIQTKYPVPSIDKIYLIKDLYIYQEFLKI